MKMVNQQKTNQIQRIETLEKHIENLSMALRVNQILLKQTIDQLQPMQSELKTNTSILSDFQYRVLGLQKYLPINNEELTSIVNELKSTDWDRASDKDDLDKKLEKKEFVSSKNDIVIISSVVLEGENVKGGIFRSKIKLEEAGQGLVDVLLNKKVGETVEAVLNDEKHLVSLLGVRTTNLE